MEYVSVTKRLSTRTALYGYIVAIAAAECMSRFAGITIGVLLDAVIVFVLLNHSILMSPAHSGAIDAPRRRQAQSFLVIALAPLLRILSVTIPVQEIPKIYWYAVAGVPILAGVTLATRLCDLSISDLAFRLRHPWTQVGIAVLGLPLSYVGFILLRPRPVTASVDWPSMLAGAVILIVFSAFTEEIIFRGLVLRVLTEAIGPSGALLSSLLFASMYIGSRSIGYVLLIGVTGLFFARCVTRTGSIWGVVASHSMFIIGVALVWPLTGV